MPRDSSGNFVLDPTNPVVPGTIVATGWANPTLTDIASALTDSLSRTGAGGMLAPFKFADGAKASPGAGWANEPTSGLYRAGPHDFRFSVLNSDVLQVTDLGLTVMPGKTFTAGSITAGSIDNTPIGGTTPAAGAFTSLTSPLLTSAGTTSINAVGAGFLQIGGVNQYKWDAAKFAPDNALVNVRDLGSAGIPWKSGYFGTSVVTPAVFGPAGGPLSLGAAGGASWVFSTDNLYLRPVDDNTRNLGAPAFRIAAGYFVSVVSPSFLSPAGSNITIGTQGAGTGGNLAVNGTNYYIWNTNYLAPAIDNAYDLGVSPGLGNVRWRSGYFGTTVSTPQIDGPTNLMLNAQGGSGGIGFGLYAGVSKWRWDNVQFAPATDLGYNLGAVGLRWNIGYIATVDSGAGDLVLKRAGSIRLTGTATGLTTTGDVIPDADNLRLFGGGGTRWANGYFGSNVYTPKVGSVDATNVSLIYNNLPAVDYNLTNFVPHNDNSLNLGFPGFTWKTGYFGTSVVTPMVSTGGDARLLLNDNGANRWYVGFSGENYALAPWLDNSYDLGIAGNRVRNGYFGGNLVVNGTVTASGITGAPAPAFESAEIAINSTNLDNVANHGLGRKPTLFGAYIRCKTANNGYSVGDEIKLSHADYTGNSVAGCSVWVSATQIGCAIGAINVIARVSLGNLFSATNANWVLVLRAW